MVADAAAEFPAQVGELLAFLGDGFPDGHPYQPLVAAPVMAERPELFVLGSSPYGPKFAAVNGFAAVFAHHMSPELAFSALRSYRRQFQPREEGAEPYSAMSVLAFASEVFASRCRRRRSGSWQAQPTSGPAGTLTAGW